VHLLDDFAVLPISTSWWVTELFLVQRIVHTITECTVRTRGKVLPKRSMDEILDTTLREIGARR
jgi:hypothetical protein